jgi:RNA polymerase sigma factor (sigma-70 family)
MVAGPDRDEMWFRDIYREHARDLHRYLARLVWPLNSDAEDLLQYTFEKAWAHRSKVPNDPRPWLFTAARYTAMNYLSKHRRTASSEELADIAVPDTTGTVDAVLDLRRELARLTPNDAEVLLLRFVYDYDIKAIGGLLGVTVPAIEKRISRAKRRLAAGLRDRPADVGTDSPTMAARNGTAGPPHESRIAARA